MHDPELDGVLDAGLDSTLERLTTVRAPQTLLPRVMAATEQLAAPPWYASTWDTWPIAHQRMSVAICLLVLAALTMPFGGGTWIKSVVARTDGRFAASLQALHEVSRIASSAEAVTNTAGSLWQKLSVPLLLYASVVGALLCLLMGLFALALNRLTPGRAFTR